MRTFSTPPLITHVNSAPALNLSLTEVPITAHNISSSASADTARPNSDIRTDDNMQKTIWSVNALVMLQEVTQGKI